MLIFRESRNVGNKSVGSTCDLNVTNHTPDVINYLTLMKIVVKCMILNLDDLILC